MAMTIAAPPIRLTEPRPGGIGAVPAERALRAAGTVLLGLFIALIGFDLMQPSPYDFLAGPVILVWLVIGVRLPRNAFLLMALLLLLCLGVFLSLVPHLDRPDSVFWAAISLYLAVTAVFFAPLLAGATGRRG